MGAFVRALTLAAMLSSAFRRCGMKISASPLISSSSREPPVSIRGNACSIVASGISSSLTAVN